MFALVLCSVPYGAFAQQPGAPEYSAHILSSFRQGSGSWFHRVGNCASVAVIKAAMATYGVDAVVMDSSPSGPNHAITLRNGATLSLTDQQIAQASNESKFILPDPSDGPGDASVLRRANYLYAVMAIEAVRWHSNDALPFQDAKDFDHALKRLLKGGIDSDQIVLLLGLDAKDVVQGGAATYVHANWVHAVFATGESFDNYGESKPIGTFEAAQVAAENTRLVAEKAALFVELDQAEGASKLMGRFKDAPAEPDPLLARIEVSLERIPLTITAAKETA